MGNHKKYLPSTIHLQIDMSGKLRGVRVRVIRVITDGLVPSDCKDGVEKHRLLREKT